MTAQLQENGGNVTFALRLIMGKIAKQKAVLLRKRKRSAKKFHEFFAHAESFDKLTVEVAVRPQGKGVRSFSHLLVLLEASFCPNL